MSAANELARGGRMDDTYEESVATLREAFDRLAARLQRKYADRVTASVLMPGPITTTVTDGAGKPRYLHLTYRCGGLTLTAGAWPVSVPLYDIKHAEPSTLIAASKAVSKLAQTLDEVARRESVATLDRAAVDVDRVLCEQGDGEDVS